MTGASFNPSPAKAQGLFPNPGLHSPTGMVLGPVKVEGKDAPGQGPRLIHGRDPLEDRSVHGDPFPGPNFDLIADFKFFWIDINQSPLLLKVGQGSLNIQKRRNGILGFIHRRVFQNFSRLIEDHDNGGFLGLANQDCPDRGKGH